MVRDRGPAAGGGPSRLRRDERRLYAELRRGLHRREFALHYQAQVALGLDGGRVRCWEALLRWPGRPEGALQPSAYLSAAERSDVGNEIGGWSLTQACADVAARAGERVAVNVAGRQLFSGVLIRQVEAAVALSGLAPERLDLEVSERVPLQVAPEAVAMLTELRGLGFGIVLDDLGVERRDLAVLGPFLGRLPLTAIKLDPSVVQALERSESARALAEGVAAHARRFGLALIAEGIETEAHREAALRSGCDHAQGFLIGPPLPCDRMGKWDGGGLGPCSGGDSASGTLDDRPEPHRRRDTRAYEDTWT